MGRIVHLPVTDEWHIYGASSVYALRVGPGGVLTHLTWAGLDPSFVSSGATLPSLAHLGLENHATAFDPWLMLQLENGTEQRIAWSKNAAQIEFPGATSFPHPSSHLWPSGMARMTGGISGLAGWRA